MQIELDAQGMRVSSATDDQLTLADCHGKRVAVLMSVQGRDRVFRGTAAYAPDSTVGRALRITIEGQEGAGAAAILIAENRWQGDVTPDGEYGCDFVVRIASTG